MSKAYALRIMPLAEADILQAHARIANAAGEEAADLWQDSLEEAISHLATNPGRPLAVESALFRVEVRAFTHRRPGSSVAHRVLFNIREDTPDGPQVRILHVRHGSAAPMQAHEARNIEGRLRD